MLPEPEPDWGLTIVVAMGGVVLVLASVVHRLMFETSMYATSFLLPIEKGLCIFLWLALGEQPIESVVHLIRRHWKAFRRNAATMGIAAVCLVLALAIDSPAWMKAP